MAPTISILLPTYNGARFLRAQIESIIAQTWDDFELLLIDDGSTDETASILSEYARRDPRIVLLDSSGNRGQKARLVELLAAARGEWIAISDQDDIWAPEKLAKLKSVIGDAGLAFGRSVLIDAFGSSLGADLLEALRSPRSPHDRLILLFRPQVSGHAMLARREVMPTSVFQSEQPYDWLISLLAEFTRGIVYEHEAVVYHRIHESNSHNGGVLQRLTPVIPGPRQVRFWIAQLAALRHRLLVGFEVLSMESEVAEHERKTFAKLACACRETWADSGSRRTARSLRRELREALRDLAGSATDLKWGSHYIDLVTLGLFHPLSIARAYAFR